MSRVLVRNAADPDQVGKAREAERFAGEFAAKRLEVVGSTYEGRQFLWEWLEKMGAFRSIMETSARIYYNAGRQDAAHELMADIIAADPELYLLMQAESIQRDKNTTEPERKHTDD